MSSIPEIEDLFITIMDLIDQRKVMSERVLMHELKVEFAQITPETLVPNLIFCLQKLVEAELIEKVTTNYRLTRKGKQVLHLDNPQVGLKEIEFYVAHDEHFFGKPITLKKPKKFFYSWITSKNELISVVVFFVLVGFLIFSIINKKVDVIGQIAVDSAFEPLQKDTGMEKKIDQTFEGVFKELAK